MTRRILVVDDEDDIREVVRLSLELAAGWEVLDAPDGAEGLHLTRTERLDAVLLDVMMPDLDGPSVFAMMRNEPATQGIPVVLLTAKLQPADRQRFADLGVAGTIPKPFDPMTLHQQLADSLGWVA